MVEGEMQGLAACASHEGDEMMAGAGLMTGDFLSWFVCTTGLGRS